MTQAARRRTNPSTLPHYGDDEAGHVRCGQRLTPDVRGVVDERPATQPAELRATTSPVVGGGSDDNHIGPLKQQAEEGRYVEAQVLDVAADVAARVP